MVQAVTTTAIMTRTQSTPLILAVIGAHWIIVVSAGQLTKTTYTFLNANGVSYISKGERIAIGLLVSILYKHKSKKCFRLFCRYITILYFLNDVEEGGHTAFPIADDATFKQQVCMFNSHVIKSRPGLPKRWIKLFSG